MKKVIPLTAMIGMLFSTAACDLMSNNQEEKLKYETTEAFRADLETLLSSYFNLTDALVDENAEEARTYAEQLNEAVSAMDASGLDRDASEFWNERAAAMKHHSEAMHGHDEMPKHRDEFTHLSDGMVEVMRAMGTRDGDLYHRSCSMFSDDEAGWLSHHEEINHNPYQGTHMGNHHDDGHHGGGHHNGHGSGGHDHNMMDCVRTVEVID